MNYDIWAENLAKHISSKHQKPQPQLDQKIELNSNWFSPKEKSPTVGEWVLVKIYIPTRDVYSFRVATYRNGVFFNYADQLEVNRVVNWRYIDLPDE